MARVLPVLILIAGVVFASAIAHSGDGESMTDAQKNVLEVVERMTEAFQKGDIEGVMRTYEESAVVVFDPESPTSDPAVLRQMFQGAFSMKPDFQYSGHEVVIAGDIAVHLAPYQMKGKTPDGAEILQAGLSVAVLRKQADGGWLMVIDNPHGERLLGE